MLLFPTRSRLRGISRHGRRSCYFSSTWITSPSSHARSNRWENRSLDCLRQLLSLVEPLFPHTLTHSMDAWTIGALVFIGYWLLCRSLRWRLASSIAKKFKGRDPYSLSVDEAQWVVKELFQLEMPHFTRFSTAFALFRTYGILTISNILLKYLPRSTPS